MSVEDDGPKEMALHTTTAHIPLPMGAWYHLVRCLRCMFCSRMNVLVFQHANSANLAAQKAATHNAEEFR